jgi:hypothetical protein
MAHSVSSSSSSSPGSASCRSASSKSNARLGVLAVPRLGLRPDGGAVRQLHLTGEPVLHPGSKPLAFGELRDLRPTRPRLGMPATRPSELHPGDLVALVGGNGAGNSTLVKLLVRFYDPGTDAHTTTPSIRKSHSTSPLVARAQVGPVADLHVAHRSAPAADSAIRLSIQRPRADRRRITNLISRGSLPFFTAGTATTWR